jgi:hypothetical protein
MPKRGTESTFGKSQLARWEVAFQAHYSLTSKASRRIDREPPNRRRTKSVDGAEKGALAYQFGQRQTQAMVPDEAAVGMRVPKDVDL